MKHLHIFTFFMLFLACSNSKTNGTIEGRPLLDQIKVLENNGQIDPYLAFRLKIFDKYIEETERQDQIKGKTIYQIIDDLDKTVMEIGKIESHSEHRIGKYRLQVRKELTQDSIEYIFSFEDLTGQEVEGLTISYDLFDIFGSHIKLVSISCESPVCLDNLDQLKVVEPKGSVKTRLVTLNRGDLKKYGIEPEEEFLYSRFSVNKLIVKYLNGETVNYDT